MPHLTNSQYTQDAESTRENGSAVQPQARATSSNPYSAPYSAPPRTSAPSLATILSNTHRGTEEESRGRNDIILGDNIARPLPGPYATPWTPSPRQLWSRDIIEDGKFDTADGALLAFIVDCAMKLYIVADLRIPACTANPKDSDVAWSVITAAQNSVRETVQSRATRALPRPGLMMRSVENLMLSSMRDLPKIRERCNIVFGQAVQSNAVRCAFASVLCGHSRFDFINCELCYAFRWVYGMPPIWVLDAADAKAKAKANAEAEAEADANANANASDGISIQSYVFNYN